MPTFYAAETAAGLEDGSSVANACTFGTLYLRGAVGDNYYLCRNEDGSAWELDSAGDDLHITAFNDGSSTNPKIISGCNHLGVIDGVRTKFKFTADPNEMFYLESDTEYVRFENIEVDMDGEDMDVIESDGTLGTAAKYCIANNIYAYNGNRCVSFRGPNCRIHNCYAKDMKEFGFVLTGPGNGIISNCVAINCGRWSSEAAYYITDGCSLVNSVASGSWGANTAIHARAVGDFCSIIGNTFDGAGDHAIESQGNGLIVANNILSNAGEYGNENNGGNELNLSDYNLYYNNTSGNYYYQNAGIHDITGDPLFTDPDNYDFSVNNKSPAWRAGTNGDTIGASLRAPHKSSSSTARYI